MTAASNSEARKRAAEAASAKVAADAHPRFWAQFIAEHFPSDKRDAPLVTCDCGWAEAFDETGADWPDHVARELARALAEDVAASNSESGALATNGPNPGASTSETANGPQNANLRSVLLESLRPFVQCGERYCGTIPGGNARCADCCDLVTTATDLAVGIVERRPQPIPAPVDSGAIGGLNESLGAVDRARLQTAAWSACNGGASGADLLYAVVESILREHTDRALAEVERWLAKAWDEGYEKALWAIDRGMTPYEGMANPYRAARQEQGR